MVALSSAASPRGRRARVSARKARGVELYGKISGCAPALKEPPPRPVLSRVACMSSQIITMWDRMHPGVTVSVFPSLPPRQRPIAAPSVRRRWWPMWWFSGDVRCPDWDRFTPPVTEAVVSARAPKAANKGIRRSNANAMLREIELCAAKCHRASSRGGGRNRSHKPYPYIPPLHAASAGSRAGPPLSLYPYIPPLQETSTDSHIPRAISSRPYWQIHGKHSGSRCARLHVISRAHADHALPKRAFTCLFDLRSDDVIREKGGGREEGVERVGDDVYGYTDVPWKQASPMHAQSPRVRLDDRRVVPGMLG
ncbi:hypothetical protein DFH08DRAFT_964725 [Mycena albidolilacea]|uniref:Uncharacterized protein n=1 Tax=Mycena albidolilacea TaxID=1033008 RepID=A0AAD6ZS46_9AGAR|nr:hypothetical protein DFH08DRAFT_964725 [Mycena albidolilacea]